MTTDNDAPAAGLVERLRKELRDARRIISATHKNPVVHTNCEVNNCPICDGGLFQCADCGAAEIETETRVCSVALQAPQEAVKELADALGYATRLTIQLMEKHYPDRSPDWKPLPDLYGVLTQIDNLSTGLSRSALSQPVATPAPRPQLGTIPNYPEYDNARIK